MTDQDDYQPLIPDFGKQPLPARSQEQDQLIVGNLRGMHHGLFCALCILEERVDLRQMPAEWQAITILDGTAMCGQHIVLKARQDLQWFAQKIGVRLAGGAQSVEEHLASLDARLRHLEQAAEPRQR